MIVHFIGGPLHGTSEAVSNIGARLVVPLAERPVYCADTPIYPAVMATGEYAVIKRARYAIAEYVEPRIKTDWHVEVNVVDRYDTDALRRLDDWLLLRMQAPRPPLVYWTAARRLSYDRASLDFTISVDGPPSAAAIADAGTKLHERLDKMLPSGIVVASVKSMTQS